MPGIRKNLKEVIWNVEIKPFYLAKYTVKKFLTTTVAREPVLMFHG